MKRVEMAKDYAEFIIRSRFVLTSLEKAMNKRDFDVAKFMAHELKITAMLLQDAIDRHEIKQTVSSE